MHMFVLLNGFRHVHQLGAFVVVFTCFSFWLQSYRNCWPWRYRRRRLHFLITYCRFCHRWLVHLMIECALPIQII